MILYGSRARGDATASSDWDLKVIVSDDAPDLVLSPMSRWKVQEGSGIYGDVSCIRLSVSDLSVANSAAAISCTRV
ncbi:nucleotidyltransferase domain-containing protein [Rhizobium ruizarguesonis]|uniref:nucleotidyltransferase domain-containing protein n=1 Tax=Rhizobium ruizarguesonis TaxID=2081791 RepID=UPI0018D57A51